jgi:type 1 fimbria pilin
MMMKKFIGGLLLTLLMAFAAQAKLPSSITMDPGVINVVNNPASGVKVPFGKYYTVSIPLYIDETDCPFITENNCLLYLEPSSPVFGNKHYQAPEGNAFAYSFKGSEAFYFSVGYRDSTGDHYQDWAGIDYTSIHSRNIQIIMPIFTPNNMSIEPHDIFISGLVASILSQGYLKTNINANVNIHVQESTCTMQNSLNQAFYWNNISPSEISNGTVTKQRAPITILCSGAEIQSIGLNVKGDSGVYDANNGIIKTDLPNLGVKLTWARDNLPVVLNKDIVYPPSAQTNQADYSIDAQPVHVGTEPIPAGSFSGVATVEIQYR